MSSRQLADLYYDVIVRTPVGHTRLTQVLRERGIDPKTLDEDALVELVVELAGDMAEFLEGQQQLVDRIQELEVG